MNEGPVDFLLMAAHDLRAPLTTLQGHTELLLKRLAGQAELDPAIPCEVQIIQREAIHLGQLLNSLTDAAWIQTGHLQLELQSVELGGLLRHLVEKIAPPLTRHTLSFTASTDVPLIVCGDPLRLEELFRNLIDNAIKYSPQGGPILVQMEAQAGAVRVAISDKGLGIDQEALPRLFTAWYRAEPGSHTGIRGLGLGLFIVWHLVCAHQGRIDVTSKPGQGSTFSVEFPRRS